MHPAILIGIIVGVVVLLGAVGWYFWQRYRLREQQDQLLGWTATIKSGGEADVPYSAISDGPSDVENPRRRRAATGMDPSELTFDPIRVPEHGIELRVPHGWTRVGSAPPGGPVVCQYVSPPEERSYKRLSVAWDDVSTLITSNERFARGLGRQLPAIVPGSEVLSVRRMVEHPTEDPWEVEYAVETEDGRGRMKLLAAVFLCGRGLVDGGKSEGSYWKAFTVTFGCDESAYEASKALALMLLSSFRISDRARHAQAPSPMGERHGRSFGSESDSGSFAGSAAAGLESRRASATLRGSSRPIQMASGGGGGSSSSGGGGGGLSRATPVRRNTNVSVGSMGSSASSVASTFVDPKFLTPTNPSEVSWTSLHWSEGCLVITYPRNWQITSRRQGGKGSRKTAFLTIACSSEEARVSPKILRLFVLDLSPVVEADPDADLLAQLADFYRAEAAKKGSTVRVLAQNTGKGHPTRDLPSGPSGFGPRTVFFVEDVLHGEKMKNTVLIATHEAGGRVLGHILTFQTTLDAAPVFDSLGRHMLAEATVFDGVGPS